MSCSVQGCSFGTVKSNGFISLKKIIKRRRKNMNRSGRKTRDRSGRRSGCKSYNRKIKK